MEQLIFPYRQGCTLRLKTDIETSPFSFHGRIQCKILNFYQPSTLSCVMEVEIETVPCQGRRFVLKLYDHRYATQLRENKEIKSYGFDEEIAYWDVVNSGDALEFLRMLREDEKVFDYVWDEGQEEIYLLSVCHDYFEKECAVYDRLKDRQGQDIPHLIAKVRLPISPSAANGRQGEFYEIKGILLELIDGFTLQDLSDRAPREDWQKICDQAVHIVQLCDKREILNKDVRASNFMVTPLPSENTYRVVMLDFALARLRGSDESDLKWGRDKSKQNEEGAIGMSMQRRLKHAGFDLVYKPSGRYEEWAPTGDDDDDVPS